MPIILVEKSGRLGMAGYTSASCAVTYSKRDTWSNKQLVQDPCTMVTFVFPNNEECELLDHINPGIHSPYQWTFNYRGT